MDVSLINNQSIEAEWLTNKQLSLDVLRLDKIDPVVSGNKWFKLKYYLEEAQLLKKTTIATFGGAWSNHIVATAFAARQAGLKSIGIIRGEKPAELSYTLTAAQEYGMELIFVTREHYRKKDEIISGYSAEKWYWIKEGGYGVRGAQGAAEILSLFNTSAYSHIICAVGTGTMLAGLIVGSKAGQLVIGISSMRGNLALEQEVRKLTDNIHAEAAFEIQHLYHFGGYGKHPPELIEFINQVYLIHGLPLDIVYTGKTFYGIKNLCESGFFTAGSKLLMIHSGGLQGNKSLPAKVLAF